MRPHGLRPAWFDDAACRAADASHFVSELDKDISVALGICRACPERIASQGPGRHET